jgi:hypothetical protein
VEIKFFPLLISPLDGTEHISAALLSREEQPVLVCMMRDRSWSRPGREHAMPCPDRNLSFYRDRRASMSTHLSAIVLSGRMEMPRGCMLTRLPNNSPIGLKTGCWNPAPPLKKAGGLAQRTPL